MSDKIKRFTKKIIAAALVLTLVGGAAVTGTVIDFAPASITANAAGYTNVAYTIDESGTLTIKAGTYENPRLYITEGKDTVKNIISEAGVIFTGDCSSLFYYFSECQSIDVSNADFSDATSLKNLFANNSKLKSVSMATIATSNVTNTSSMFSHSPLLETLDLDINTSNVTDMSFMFCGCKYLRNVVFSNLNTQKVTNMNYMFEDCYNLESFPTGSLTANKETSLSYMFQNCRKLTEIDLQNFVNDGTSQSGSQSFMFVGCGVEKIIKNKSFVITQEARLINQGISADLKSSYSGWYEVGDPSNIITQPGVKTYAELSDADEGTFLLSKTATGVNYSISGDTLTLVSGVFKEGDVDKIFSYAGPAVADVTKIVVSSDQVSFANNSSQYSGLFESSDDSGLRNVKEIDVSKANFSNAENLHYMFRGMSKLENVTFGSADLSSVTDVTGMFYDCSSLVSIDLSQVVLNSCTNFSSMFYDCKALKNVDFGDNFNTGTGESFENMFAYCSDLTEMDLSKLSFAAATDLKGMFRSCSSLKELNFGNDIDTGNVQYFDSMFYDCSSLNKINGLTKFNTLSATSFSSMFYGCTSLSELDLSSFDASNAVSANPDYYSDVMFSSSGIRTITISDKFPIKKNAELLNTGAVDNAKSAVLGWIVNGDQSGQIISGGDEYAEINGAGTYIRKTSELKWSYDIFDGSEGGKRALTLEEGEYNSSILESIKTECGHMLEAYNEEHGTNYNVDNYWEPEVFSYIVNDGVTFFGNCSDMFDARYTGHSVSLEFKGHIVTQHLTNMAGMFEGSESAPFTITGLDLNDYDTSEVTDMSRLFVGLDVEELNVSSFDTRNVEKMVGMFKNVKAKKIIFGDKFDTSKVYAMGGMFRDSKVAALNLSGFNTANVGKIPENTSLDSDEEGMKAMFSGCESLTTLDLSSFNTTSVTTMENMFSGCTGLEDIIFGNDFNIKGITYDGISGMFRDCSSLTNIDFSTFVGSESNTPANSISDMFSGCSSLKTVDLSSVKLDNVQSVSDAFSGCSSLEAVTLPVLSQYSYFYDAFDGCTRLCNLSLPVGSKINEYSKLPNKNAVFTGWHKSDSAEIVSGTGKYAEFTVEKTEATDSDIVTYLRDYAEYNNCIVNGASLTLEGQIGLNFYAVFPKDVLQDPDSYVLLSGPEGDQKIMLNDAGFDIDNGFRFTYKLSAAQLKDKVTFSVYSTGGNKQILLKDNNGTPVSTGDANTYSFSIQDYVNTVKQNDSDYDFSLVKLVKAIETYGTYAQLYFDYNRDSANTTGLVSIDNINADNMYYNSFYISDGIPQDLKFEGYSLVLDSETKLKFYFSCDDIKKHTFTVGGKKLTPVSVGDNKYYVAIENISAKNLRKEYYLYIDGNTEYIYTYPLSYARTAVRKYQNSNNAKKLELCNVMRALYRYSEAAYDYFGSPDYD